MFGMQIGRMGQTRFATWDQIVATMYQNGQVGGNLSFTDFSKIWQDSAGTTPYTAVEQYVGKIVDKSPNALAFTQATNAARPAVSARVNLLTNTEDFANAAWAKLASASVVANTIVAPDGLTSADTLSITSAFDILRQTSAFPAGTNAVVFSIWIKAVSGSGALSIRIVKADTSGVESSAIVTPTATWTRYVLTATCTGSAGNFIVDLPGDGNAKTIAIWGASLVLSIDAHLPYQRVNTATDYDTVGFPNYAKLDGIDDNWVSAAGGGGTAGIYYCGAIQFNKSGAVQTILSDAGTNSGYKLQLTAANQLQISAGNGTAFTAVNTTATFAVGDVSLVELWDDGTNLGVLLGDGTPVTVARPVVTAGTSQITLGKDNNAASNYAGISMFEPVWRYGAMPNTTQREAIRAYCRSKAGIA